MSLSHLEALFEYAVELDDGQREQFLDELASDSQSIADGLRCLLLADRTHATAPKLQWSGTAARLLPGATVGGFSVREWIASGGMADVYLAERAAGSAVQRVALKLLKNEIDPRMRARMTAEQSTLATLDHPGIAKLIEAGIVDRRPYVAMAYVDGVPIDTYADAHRCSLRARVELVLAVCDALAAAHASLIVHRDIKASNVLVTDQGHVQVIDFGIAKSLDVERDLRETSPTARFFSPHYAAPEQWRGRAHTVAVDVYGAGALLYELLCGATLFDFSQLSFSEMERHVAEVLPKRLDLRFGELADAERARISAGCARSEAALSTELRNDDLNAILQKCLRKEARSRYSTIDAFSADLRLFLGGFPVAARRGSAAYRMRKFVQRNWKPLSVAAVVCGISLAGLATFLQLDRARRSESERADAVGGVLLEAVRSADPTNTLGLKITAAEILANSERILSTESTNVPPATRAQFLVSIAGTYEQLGDAKRALAILDRAAIPDSAPSTEHLFVKARAIRALEELEAAKKILQGIPAADLTTEVRIELELAQVEYSAGEYKEMNARMTNLLARLPLKEHRKLEEDVRYWHAISLSATGEYSKAVDALQSLLKDQQASQADVLRIQRTMTRMVNEYNRLGSDELVLPLQEKIDRINAEVFGEDSFQYRSRGSNSAYFLARQGKLKEGLARIDDALAAMDERLGPNHRRTVMLGFDAALLHEASPAGPARALSLYRKVIDGSAVAFSADHPNRFLFHVAYAFFALETGDVDTTLRLCDEALAIADRNKTVQDWDLFAAVKALQVSARWRQDPTPEFERRVRAEFARLAVLVNDGKVEPQTLEKTQLLQKNLGKAGLTFAVTESL